MEETITGNLLTEQELLNSFWENFWTEESWILLLVIKIFQVLDIVFYLLTAWWLYLINKKLGIKYPWLSWVPILQIYSYVKASGKSFWWILWIILGFIALIIPGVIIYIIFLHWISKRTWRWWWTTTGLFFVPFIMFPVVWYKLKPINNNGEETDKKETEEQNEL